MTTVRFPPDFLWGAATSAYQIEGAADIDGRSPSIWDTFSRVPGKVHDGDTGDVACDHYHRWPDDLDLMKGLGLGAYRFSIAWPRVVPDGVGTVNREGLDFYDRLVDGLLERGIVPLPTLYHWDLPQVLDDRGGWADRATAEAFAAYAGAVVERLGDRVRTWTTFNEPFCTAILGHFHGMHAPGRHSLPEALAAGHHVLVAHALGVDAIRAARSDAEVGIVLNFTPQRPASDDPDDVAAAELSDAIENRWYLDPLAGRGYPQEAAGRLGWDMTEVLDGDLERIARPIDFLGVNYYTRQQVTTGDLHGQAWYQGVDPVDPVTDIGWAIHPPSFTELLLRVHEALPDARIYITENGAAYNEGPKETGEVDDARRIDYLRGHIGAVHDAMAAGVPVAGYLVWTFLDNFEWSYGYEMRFGIVHVDYATQARTLKASARWFGEVARSRSLVRST
ncbi:MAG: GH1 family beta-glucosidase [Actinomycetota bacterium]|nr:GH1 family beta-glucosidase [Actinomycetota bacterium]